MLNRTPILKEDLQMISNADLPWESFANKTILVSGANGFLPAYMIETLLYLNDILKLNCKIIGIIRNQEKAQHRFRHYLQRNDLQLLLQDVSQEFTIKEKIHYIIHAASQASPKYYGVDPVGTLSANVLGTHYLLQLARTQEIESFLYFSSGEVYGEVNEIHVPTKEHMYGYVDPINVRSCYAESKKMGENMCVAYAHQFGLSVKIVRPFHIYGPGLSFDDGRVYSDFVADIVHKRDITMYGDGTAIRSFCYLADAVVGFFTVLLKGKNSEAYNIGNPKCSLSIVDLALRLAKLFSDRDLKVVKKERLDQVKYMPSKISINCPDISKAIDLGWQPHISIEEGFIKTVESFHERV